MSNPLDITNPNNTNIEDADYEGVIDVGDVLPYLLSVVTLFPCLIPLKPP